MHTIGYQIAETIITHKNLKKKEALNKAEELLERVEIQNSNKVLNYSLTSSLDLENIQDFIENGIDGNPLNTKIWFNPDGSIDTTVPVKLSLIEGADNLVDSGERYFTISFELVVTSNSDGNDNNYAATQTWSLPADSSIQVSYTENLVTVSKNIVNKDFDQITLQDSNTGEQSNQLDNFLSLIHI